MISVRAFTAFMINIRLHFLSRDYEANASLIVMTETEIPISGAIKKYEKEQQVS